MRVRPVWLGLSVALATAAGALAKPDFGMDPLTELAKLERGDLKLLSQIKLQSGGDLRSFIAKHHLSVVHRLSDVSCRERPMGNAGDGCTIDVHVNNGRLQGNIELCSTLVRFRRPAGNKQFVPESGGAIMINERPEQFLGSLNYMVSRCS